ncbi:G patch domain and ankyrin repeat-containing protein 1 homolog isoform X1 [Phymastichus coffea]|uniref:G patch domain and ankyrin repeat-containing protein 1 homolog isoform X1 n=1 Tax=Phymastichus coffea TaxID=108790 RepID=UPI00273AC30D|nr:G patch domain and ankyrin repeat-containing protein 1 homolog isoform X1 [Phymastichus coffea]
MSRAVNNLALSYLEIPIKTFVRETCQIVSCTQPKNSNLQSVQFENIKAHEAYNEIISQESQTKPLLQRSTFQLTNKKKNSKITSASKATNDLNTLFKAVELGDKDFVYQSFDGQNVNISDQFGWTPLMSAACSGHIVIVDFLLKLGADVKIRDKSGLSAIDVAVRKHHIEIVNLLKLHLQASKSNNSDKIDQVVDEIKKVSEDFERFYCKICNTNFVSSSRRQHDSSIVHIFNCKPKVANIFYGIPVQNRGYQMLLNKGWNEQDGLGPTGEGQKYPVKTVLKRDRKGFSESHRKFARVTHFDSNDVIAIKSVCKKRKTRLTKQNKKKELRKEVVKTRAWRQLM